MEQEKIFKEGYTPAIPPENYTGTISGWMTSLIQRSLWNPDETDWYGDVQIPTDVWWEILEENEKSS